jgi:hypothetical protein
MADFGNIGFGLCIGESMEPRRRIGEGAAYEKVPEAEVGGTISPKSSGRREAFILTRPGP